MSRPEPQTPRADFTGRLALAVDGSVNGVLVDCLGDEITFTGTRNEAGYYLEQNRSKHPYIGEMRRVDGMIQGVLTRGDGGSIAFTAAKEAAGYAVTGTRGAVPGWCSVPLVDVDEETRT